MPTDKCGENREFGKTLFSNMTEQIVLGKNHQSIVNVGRKFGEKQNICIFQIFFSQIAYSFQKENSYYTLEKLAL